MISTTYPELALSQKKREQVTEMVFKKWNKPFQYISVKGSGKQTVVIALRGGSRQTVVV